MSINIDNTSEEACDPTCTLCAKRSKTIETVKFCLKCWEYLCSGCTEWHNTFPLTGMSDIFQKFKMDMSVIYQTKALNKRKSMMPVSSR